MYVYYGLIDELPGGSVATGAGASTGSSAAPGVGAGLFAGVTVVKGWDPAWDKPRRRITVEALREILKAQGSSWADELGDAVEVAEVAEVKQPKRRKVIAAAIEHVSASVHDMGHDWGAVTRSLNAVATAQRETTARKHAENIRLILQANLDAENDDEEALMLLLYG